MKATIPVDYLDELSICYLAVGSDGRILYANSSLRRLLSVHRGQTAVGGELVTVDGEVANLAQLDALVQHARSLIETEFREETWVGEGGTSHVVRWLLHPVSNAEGAEEYVEAIGLPIANAATPSASLLARRISEYPGIDSLMEALDQVDDHVAIASPAGTIEYVNAALISLLGHRREELLGRPLNEMCEGLLEGNPSVPLGDGVVMIPRRSERVARRSSGELFVDEMVFSSLRDETGKILHYLAVGRDSTSRHLTDPLTSLGSRDILLTRLKCAMARFLRDPEQRFALVFLDVDRFKSINDAYGCEVGDQVIVGIAERLVAQVRSADLVAHVDHLNRDEFGVLLEGFRAPVDAFRAANRILRSLEAPMTICGHEVVVAVSAGIALARPQYDDPSAVICDAETAMMRAKRHPVERCQIFEPRVHQAVVRRVALGTDLRRALTKDELVVYYQPVVDMGTGIVFGAEALLRWQHPERGIVAPLDLIPVAEEDGLIVPLGRHVLTEACRQMKSWHEEGRFTLSVAVNVSLQQLLYAHFVEDVQAALADTELEPEFLELEITESAISKDSTAVGVVLSRVRELGVRILLDDVGTGCSSLDCLAQLPLHKLKIDRSFVMRTPHSSHACKVVATIVTMARGLGLGVVAEGVETPAQREYLMSLGCEEAQGYIFGRPISPLDFSTMLKRPSLWVEPKRGT